MINPYGNGPSKRKSGSKISHAGQMMQRPFDTHARAIDVFNEKFGSEGGKMDNFGFGGHHMDIFDSMRKNMGQMMGGMNMNFGGRSLMGNDPDFGDLGKRMESMMQNFGQMDIDMPSSNSGNMVCNSYVMSSSIGEDGKRHVEKKYTNSAQTRGKNGELINEKNEMYKNSRTGEQRIAKERNLGDQGRKMVRKRTTNGKAQIFSP